MEYLKGVHSGIGSIWRGSPNDSPDDETIDDCQAGAVDEGHSSVLGTVTSAWEPGQCGVIDCHNCMESK